jgi:hypothetical protein
MIEKLLFSTLIMPGEFFRIAIAILGTGAATYYDIFNNRNVPDNILYAFLIIAFLTNLVFLDMDVLIYACALTAILFAFGFVLYRSGQIGGADLFVACSITLLLPIHPSFLGSPFNYPLIFSAFLYSGAAFAIYSLLFFTNLIRKAKKAKPNYAYLVLILPYLLFTYIFISAPFFSPVYFFIASLLLLSSIFFLVFKDAINEAVTAKVPLSKITDEDVLVKEKMAPLMKKLEIGPVLGAEEMKKLRKAKVREVWIYATLPPFLPFLLIGLILSIFLGNWLLLSF